MPMSSITDRPIRFALVGCGRISKNHVEALAKHAGRAEWVAVCDTNPEALSQAVKAKIAKLDARP